MLALTLLAAIPGLPVDRNTLLLGGAAGGAVVLLLFVIVLFRGRRPKETDAGTGEDLASLPPPPSGKRTHRLRVMNQPGRVRLVVIAPVGKRTVGNVGAALEEVFGGLGEVVADDKPKVRIWGPQLSTTGFAPTFFREVRRPDEAGRTSRWILLAGPARAGDVPVLLGMAVLADAPSKLGLVTMTELQWGEVLKVEPA